jgi:hypothetical protein
VSTAPHVSRLHQGYSECAADSTCTVFTLPTDKRGGERSVSIVVYHGVNGVMTTKHVGLARRVDLGLV